MADYIVEGPDGKKVRISAPNEDALNHAVGEMFNKPPAPGLVDQAKDAAGGLVINMTHRDPPGGAGSGPPAAAPPKEPSMVDTIMSGADTAGRIGAQGAIGIRKGVSAIAGLPVDMATGALNLGAAGINKLTGTDIKPIEHPVGGSESIDKLFAAPARAAQAVTGAPQEDTVPQSFPERLTRRIGEEVGSAAVPVVGALAKAGRVGVEGARELPSLARMFVEPAAVDPAKFVSKEASAAVAAGSGAGLVNETTGKAQADAKGQHATTGQQIGDMGGALGGVGVSAVGKKIIGAGGHVISALTGRSAESDRVIRDVATDEIARAAGLKPGKNGVIDTGPLAHDIEQGGRVADTIPGFQESTADTTKNGGLASMEYSRQSGPNSGLYAGRRTANTTATDNAMKRSEPQGTPGAFSSELEGERDRLLREAAMRRSGAEDTAAAAVQPLQPQGTQATRGNTIRTELEGSRETARTATEDAYSAANVNDVPMHPTHLAEALDGVTGSLTQAERGLVPQGLVDRVSQLAPGEGGTVRLKEATDLRSELQRLQRAALTDPNAERGGRNAARVLGQYIDAVDGVINRTVSPEQRTALDTARGVRREEGDAFGRRGDPVAEALARGEGGNPRMRDENVARLSTRDDAMGRFLEEADTPANRAAIQHELLSNADTSTAAGLHDFQQRYAAQLQRFPGLNDQLGEAVRARVSENTARGAEGGLLADIGREGRGPVAKYLQYGDENAHKAMQAVMSAKDPARAIDQLLSFVGDAPAAVEGARKVFWDIMQKKTRSSGSTTKTMAGDQPYLPAALKRFTEDPATAAVAERLYRDNPEHWDNIKKIAEAVQGVDVRNAAKAPNTSGTPQGLKGGMLPSGETIASRVFAVERGVVSPAFAIINVLGIVARKAMKTQNIDAVNKAIDTALLNPEFAAALLKDNNPANRAALRRSANGWKGHEASTLVDLLTPKGKDDETKDAAMRGAK